MNEPLKLFKYLFADKLEFFEERLVLLTPPIYLNDPWDFLPGGRAATDEEIQNVYLEIERDTAQTSIIHLPDDFARRQQKDRLEAMRTWAQSKEFAEGLSKYSQKRISSTHGVVSLTERPLCRLMWAHYADSHTGFVAEFTTRDPCRAEDGRVFYSCMNVPAGKVEYPPAFKLDPWTPENIATACWSKHPYWEREREWRILWLLNDRLTQSKRSSRGEQRYCLRFEPQHLARVIFGMRMNPEEKQRLRNMLNQDDFALVQKQTTDIDSKTGELILKPLP